MYAAVAASTEIMHAYDQDGEGRTRLWIQHGASGLRALFVLHGDGFGSVESKSTLGSIDPAKPETLDAWRRVTGLGIGRRIYEEAHRLEPDVRWGAARATMTAATLTHATMTLMLLFAFDAPRFQQGRSSKRRCFTREAILRTR